MLPIKQILVPVDGSRLSQRAFRFAASLARDHDSGLIVLSVVPLAAMMYGPPPENYLDHLREELSHLKPDDPKTCVQYRVDEGKPAAVILRTAREARCDLIVMGTHGRTGLNRLLRGSVAEKVVREAPCLVLTLKSQAPDDSGTTEPAVASPRVAANAL